MKRSVAIALVAFFVLAQTIPAQAPPQPPKPGPAHKRLAYFVGTWTAEGEAKASPFGPAGKFSVKERNEWFTGGLFLVTHADEKGPLGEVKGLSIMGYDPDQKVYTYYAINSAGMIEASKGTVSGDTWTWTSDTKAGGKMVKSRFTVKEVSPTSYNYKFETADGGNWTTIMEGTCNKVVAEKAAKAAKAK
jgi:hypothetical protein